MENELDLVLFEDDKGDTITMEVVDYFFYEGQEYAMLTEYDEQSDCDDCDKDDCEGCDEREMEVTIMKVVPVGDDEEEFVPIEEELAEKLIEMIQSGAFDDDDDDDFDDDDDDDEETEDE